MPNLEGFPTGGADLRCEWLEDATEQVRQKEEDRGEAEAGSTAGMASEKKDT